MIGELDYDRGLIQRAREEGRWWDLDRHRLVSGTWHRHYEILGGEPGLENAYRATENAHQEIDRLNHRADERYREEADQAAAETGFLDAPILFDPPEIRTDDHLGRAVATIDAAREQLSAVLFRLART